MYFLKYEFIPFRYNPGTSDSGQDVLHETRLILPTKKTKETDRISKTMVSTHWTLGNEGQ